MERTIKNREQGIKLEEEMTREMEIQKDVAQGLDEVLGNVFANAKDGWQAMADAAIESIERIVAELLAKKAVLAIMNILFPGTGSGMNEGLSLISSFAPNMAMGHFASGTNFAPGGLSIVGEHGPELVNLPRGSQVIPNGRGGTVALRGLVVGRDLQLLGELRQNMINTCT
jgi:hypothetical protein